MYKITVHVKNKEVVFDPLVSIEIKLPFVPKVGDCILLNNTLIGELEIKAAKYDYYWISKYITNSNRLSFDKLHYVDKVGYVADSDEIHIDMDCYSKSYGM